MQQTTGITINLDAAKQNAGLYCTPDSKRQKGKKKRDVVSCCSFANTVLCKTRYRVNSEHQTSIGPHLI